MNIVRKQTPETKAALKGGNYIRLVDGGPNGDLQTQFKRLMQDLGFDPENPRADKAVKQVGEMVAGMGLELARACLAAGVENFTQYKEWFKAHSEDEAEAPAEVTPEASPKA